MQLVSDSKVNARQVATERQRAVGRHRSRTPSESDKLFGSGSLKLADDEIKLTESDSDRQAEGAGRIRGRATRRLQLARAKTTSWSSSRSRTATSPSAAATAGFPWSIRTTAVCRSSSRWSWKARRPNRSTWARKTSFRSTRTWRRGFGGAQVRRDFLLTPIEDAADESDSGSQVIALDAEEEFGGGFGSSPALLEEDLGAAAPLVAPGLAPAAAWPRRRRWRRPDTSPSRLIRWRTSPSLAVIVSCSCSSAECSCTT